MIPSPLQRTAIVLCLLAAGARAADVPADPTRMPDVGMASIWTMDVPANEARPEVRAIQGFMTWSGIQPTSATAYDWSKLDAILARAESLGKPVMLQINGNVPGWMGSLVPKLNFTSRGIAAHQFWHPTYIARYRELLQRFAERIAASGRQHLVLGVRVQGNAFNTEAWSWDYNNSEVWNEAVAQLTQKGAPDPTHPDNPVNWTIPAGVTAAPVMLRADEATAAAYVKEITAAYRDIFHPRGIRTFVRVEWYSSAQLRPWLVANYFGQPLAGVMDTGFGVWQGGSSRLAEIREVVDTYGVRAYAEDVYATFTRMRAASPGQEFYWRQLFKLHAGILWSATYQEDLDQFGTKAWSDGVALFNRFASTARADASTGAFLVFCNLTGTHPFDNIGYRLRQVSTAATLDRSAVGVATDHFGYRAKELTGASLALAVDPALAATASGRQLAIRIVSYETAGAGWKLRARNGAALVDVGTATAASGWQERTFTIAASAIPGNGTDDLVIVKTGTANPVFHLVQLEVVGALPVNKPPTVDAGPARSAVLPAAASLDGTVADDGLPAAGSVTTAWSVVSGPGAVAFADAGAVDTTATFTVAGTYSLRLTASDGALSAADTVSVTVQAPVNTPPTISAIADRTTLIATVTLAAFTVGDAQTAATALTLAKASSDTGLLPLGNITFSGTGAERSVRLKPAAGRSGPVTVTITVTDAGGLTASTSFVLTVAPLPPGLSAADIGAVGLPGSAQGDGSSFTVSGAGADIWGNADAFHYVWMPVTGDVDQVVRVTSFTAADPWAKAGIMLRDGGAAGARHISLFVTPAKGVVMQFRTTTGGKSGSVAGSLVPAPVWLKLSRRGSAVTGYQSTDGVAWRQVAQRTLGATTVWVGLAVCSSDPAALATATFQNHLVTPIGSN